MENILVVAPHPDDEVLGCGGTIARLTAEGRSVTVVIVTKGMPPLFPAASVRRVRSEARKASRLLGVTLSFLNLPVTTLHLMPEHKLNRTIGDFVGKVKPDTVFVPFAGDRHEDHRQIFDAVMVATRPDGRGHRVNRIVCYETVSETHWSAPGIEPTFEPNLYVDITDTLEAKLAAMRIYESQLEEAIPARSLEAIESLARFRGSVVGMGAAEAFQIIRDLLPAEPGSSLSKHRRAAKRR
jgi:LmbE family N-acetylglucosaminyl deacetylase